MTTVKYFLDTEFNSFGGKMISLALVREDGESLYLIEHPHNIQEMRDLDGMDPWIEKNVIDNLYAVPPSLAVNIAPVAEWGWGIARFIYRDDETPQIIADWPSDIQDLCGMLLTGPGVAVPMGNQTHLTILRHIDVYPTSLEGAVQHNAWWDAMALRRFVEEAAK